mgnify:CR=1 FL=1
MRILLLFVFIFNFNLIGQESENSYKYDPEGNKAEYFFGKFNTHVVTYLCKNHFNYPQCFDLLHDPVDYFDLLITYLILHHNPDLFTGFLI